MRRILTLVYIGVFSLLLVGCNGWGGLHSVGYYVIPDGYDSSTDLLLIPGETITQVFAGYNSSFILTSTGRVFLSGLDNSVASTRDTSKDYRTPTELTDNYYYLDPGETVVQFSTGNFIKALLTSDGHLYMWGDNPYGQIGDGTSTDRETPVEVSQYLHLDSKEKIIEVSLGLNHSSALTSAGRLFLWGRNQDGEIGDGSRTTRYSPVEITSSMGLSKGESIVHISMGALFSSALTSSGRLFMWGKNDSYELGDGTSTTRLTPTEVTESFQLSLGETILQISMGADHSSALTSLGRVFMWGASNSGQIGDGLMIWEAMHPTDITDRFSLASGETIIQIDAFWGSSSALTSSGRLFMWGYNLWGKLGDGTTDLRWVPTEITDSFDLASGETIVEVSLGNNHSCALTSAGRPFFWGWNIYGQLGDGTTDYHYTPTDISGYFLSPELVENQEIRWGASISAIPMVRDGYEFSGWFLDPDLSQSYEFGKMPNSDLILYGKWTPNS